jgi:hypothetical protein
MTTEELIAAGLPIDPVVEGAEHAAPTEDVGSPSGSRSREDGEVQSDDGEDIGDVDASVSDLVKTKSAGPLPPSLVFGESKVTANMIREYEKAGFFPSGARRAPHDEQIPTPKDGEVVVFRDFFICGLRFPCDPILPAILDAFSVKIHQLSPTSFLEVSKFIWIMKTFGCNLNVHAFAWFYELVIIPEVIKASDGQFYHTQHACCTFNTRRQNTRKGITRIQIAPCCKTNLTEDWTSHWFYLKVNMLEVPGYTGPAHPLSCPIAPLTAVNTAEFNHRAVGIRNCESAFHLASTILGGLDIIEEFVAARIWPISSGWSPTVIVYFNVNWVAQEVPFPKFGIKLHENQSADAFMTEIEKMVNVMIGEYTMNEYKAYKALVKHKKRINRVFTEVCGDKSFSSRGPGPKLMVPAVAVTSCSTAPINAPRMRSSKRGSSSVSESTSPGVKPSRTRSLESSKRKRKTSDRTSDAELQAALGLAQMSRKKLKKAVKKVSSAGVRRVPSAFDDDDFVEADSRKGVCFWPLLNFRDNYPSGSENEFIDVDSFSDAAPEVHKEVEPAAADESIVAADVTAPAESPAAAETPAAEAPAADQASSEFTKELELTIQRGENPTEHAPLVEVRETVPEDQAPSPSLAAFNKSFGTSHRGKLLHVGFETTGIGSKTSKFLTLWKSPAIIDETGGEASERPEGAAQDSEKGPHSTSETTPSSLGKTSSGSAKQVTMQHFSKQGSFLLTTFSCLFRFLNFDLRLYS